MNLTPEHLHVAFNHLTLIGMLAALVPLLVGVVIKQRATYVSGLLIVVLFGATTALTMKTGEEAYERFELGLIQPALDAAGNAWMHEHEEIAEAVAIGVYITTGLAAVALALVFIKPALGRAGAGVVAVLAFGTAMALVSVASSGGRIRHPEFRDPTNPLPASATQGEHDNHEH